MRSTLLALVALVACDAEMTEPTSAELPTDQAPAVLNNSPEWDLLTSFEGDPQLGTGALYGRATARTMVGGGRCSGSLVDDDILITADHCGNSGTTTAIFGEYGFSNTNHLRGINEARRRLRQLGVPSGTVSSLSDSVLTTFTCTFDKQDGNRDVAYWECDGNDISWSTSAGSFTYTIMPGHIWGHYNVQIGSRPEGRDAYTISVNRTCAHSNLNTLLSPGEVDDSSDGCNSDHGSCFDVTTDWIGGSSGGMIVDATTHNAFGIVNGHNWWWFGNPNDPCDRWDAANNTGSYIGNGIQEYRDEDADGGGWAVGYWRGPTNWIGSTSGNRSNLYCPSDTLAAGVVGSTGSTGEVGNFGLICVPHNQPWRLRMDRATVLAGGSIDTDFQLANQMDWNTYINEVLTTDSSAWSERQTMAMCPAGSFITGVQAVTDRFVSRISRIHCADPQNGKVSSVYVNGNTGYIGTSWSGGYETASCPSNSYFAGLNINHGWLTDGFSGYCRNED